MNHNTIVQDRLTQARVRLSQLEAIYAAAYAEWEIGRIAGAALYEASAKVEAQEALVRDLEQEARDANH